MAVPKILLTGATGYVGGTVLHRLIINAPSKIDEASITVLVRGKERAQKLKEAYGSRITCVQFEDWNQSELLSEVASQHDIVINAGSGFHPPSAEALIRGVARREKGGFPAWVLHTSGCSNISDKPMTGTARPEAEYRDADAEAVLEFEKSVEASEGQYPQRTSEILALETGVETGVNVMSIQAPFIYGTGEGLFQNAGLVIPIMMAYVLSRGYGFFLHKGTAVIDYVHVSDLADWYVLCVERILTDGGKDFPSGRKGIVFPENGRILVKDIAIGCVETAYEKGLLPKGDGPKQPEVRVVDLVEAATTTAGNAAVAEAGWGGHRRTTGTVAKSLGWKSVHGSESFKKDLEDELDFALQGKRSVTIDNCIAEKK